MALLTSSFVQACCKGFNEVHLRSAIFLEVERGYRNTIGRSMRFSNFLHSKLIKWSSRSNHMSAQKLLEEVSGYSKASLSERSRVLNKISVLMGYSNIQDLIEQERSQRESETDLACICERFPSIKLGDSSFIELYEEIQYTDKRANDLQYESRDEYITNCSRMWAEEYKKLFSEHQLSFPQTASGQFEGSGTFSVSWESIPPLSDIDIFSSKAESSYSTLPDSQEANSNETNQDYNNIEKKMKTTSEPFLDRNIRSLPGLTSRICRQLEESGFYTVRKLLQHFPRTYADLQNALHSINDGQYAMFVGAVLYSRAFRASSSFSFLEVVIGCEFPRNQDFPGDNNDYDNMEKKMIHLHLKKFFRGTRFTSQPFLKSIQSKYKGGDRVYVSGKVRKMRSEHHYEMKEYSIDMLEEEENWDAQLDRKPYPLYPSKAGLKPCFLRQTIRSALKVLTADMDPLPDDILKEFNLLNLCDAYMGIHHPLSLSEADLARRRLIFDDFFYLQLGRLFQMLDTLGSPREKESLLDKCKNQEIYSVGTQEWCTLTNSLLKALPYSLTPSQKNAVSEIVWDLKRPVPMNRLLQGDVGCGKTVVAFLACMEVIGSGFQAAFMVPTELLAIQHYELLLSLLENIGDDECKPSVALLTGSTSTKQSRIILKGLQTGEMKMVIGTHSLIAEKIEFSALRIAVVDEQHRFGVIQRGRFNSKLYTASLSLRTNLKDGEDSEDKGHMAPHILAMSATPIPRTLALALYGDMSLTQITDLPPGRTPIETSVLEGNETGFEIVFQIMKDDLEIGGKIYLVYPVIDESEQLPELRAANADFLSISEKFQGYQCGLLHGRMKSEDKDDALRKFKSGESRILLATQVIEIGVDVPDASMMVVMNAERFGIAQLHQLRGRVGRGERKSKCFFLSSTSASLERLKVLEKSSDAFHLANMDLLLRGPGNLLGKRQSGHLPEFPIARLEIDGNILQEAHDAALKVLGASNDLELFPELKAELSMRQPLCILGD